MFGGIIKPAISAGVEISAAGGTLLAAANPAARFNFENFAAFPTAHKETRE